LKRYTGVRHITMGVYEINFRPYRKARRVYQRIRAKSLQEAFQLRTMLIAEYMRNHNMPIDEMDRARASVLAIQKLIENDLKSDNKNRKTINRFLSTVKTFSRFLSINYPQITEVDQLGRRVFAGYKDYVVLHLERMNGWRAELSILKSVFSRLYKRGFCDKFVLEELSIFKRPPRREKYYKDISKTNMDLLLERIKRDRRDIYGIVYLIYRLGWRIEETTLLKKEDVKFEGLTPVQITVRSEITKTKTKRILDTFDEELANVVRQYAFDKREVTWLFPNSNNNRFTSGRVRDYLKKISSEVIGFPITPHDFRHRFCTIMGHNNIPIKDVMAISGIQDTQVLLDFYTHSTQIGKQMVLEKSRTE